MKPSRWLTPVACGIGLLYAAVTLVLKPSFALTAFGDIAQLILAGLVTVAFAIPAFSSRGRVRSFWALMTVGVGFWFLSQAIWTYYELVARIEVVDPSIQDIVLFLHLIPMMAALATQPHKPKKMAPVIPYSLGMLAIWWMYLYSYVVIPWQYVAPNFARYGADFNILYSIEDLAFMVALCVLAWRSIGAWRTLYFRLLLGSMGYLFSALMINTAIDERRYYTGSYFDLPLVFSVICICWSATSARTPNQVDESEEESRESFTAEWLTRLAYVALLSVPLMAAYALEFGDETEIVRDFRIGVSLIAIVTLAGLLYLLQRVLSDRLHHSLMEVRHSNEKLSVAREALEHQATHDSMTGAMNRCAITEALDRELARSIRSGARVAVLLIDLDHFKDINDKYGHHAGDVAIITSCERMQQCVRSHDFVGRYGGEEFLVVVPETEYVTAMEIAERIREHLSATPITWSNYQIRLTATIGVALSRPGDTAEEILRRADVALYNGKSMSRDTVQVVDEDVHVA
ncbi:MAG TPA: GGDEF domain-containing protein [Terriglobales bacterium]|nr:GGDEF domain-containing protein [Terriglobales bacterium]